MKIDYQTLLRQIQKKKSFLCVGLDPDIKKIPKHLLGEEDPIFEFNKAIIDSTADYTVAYKPNTAFYESLGSRGWLSLERTIAYIKEHHPEIFTIADAKRGDIGNTSAMYARTFFDTMEFDSVTVAPYMGSDSVKPFLGFDGKWVILLALTSNEGAGDFQFIRSQTELYKKVILTSQHWADHHSMMYVVGATKAEFFKEIRDIAPEHFLLVPGVGAQGGNLEDVCRYGLNKNCGLLINSSRAIIYASSGNDFAKAAAEQAEQMQQQMERILCESNII